MSGQSEILREYLIRLGYQTDLVSVKRFEESLSEMQKKLFKVSAGVVGIITATGVAATSFSYNMRKMYFAADLANTSVNKLEGFGFAGKQIGLASDSMEELTKNLAQAIRYDPGVKALIQSLGVQTEGVTTDQVVLNLVEALKKMDPYIGAQFAQKFGMTLDQFYLLSENIDKFKHSTEEADAVFRKFNLNPEDSRKSIEEYTHSLDLLGLQFETLGKKILYEAQPYFKAFTDLLSGSAEGLAYGMDRKGGFWAGVWQDTKDVLAEDAKRITGFKNKMFPSAENVMDFFISKGWSAEQSAGIAANLHAESGFDETAKGDGGKAYGLAQWHPDRQQAFKRAYGKDIRESSFEEQLDFINYELTKGSETKAGFKLRQSRTATDAGTTFAKYYERPASTDYSKRAALADAYLGRQNSANNPNVSINQTTNINVSGNEKEAIARSTAREQDRVNGTLLRKTKGLVE